MPLRLLLALVLLAPGAGRVAGGAGPGLAPQRSTPAPTTIGRLESWVALISAHKPGELDEAARQVAAWPRATLDLVFRYQKAFLVLVSDPDPPELALLRQKFSRRDLEEMDRLAENNGLKRRGLEFLKRAALLHTDIAMLAPASGNLVVPFFDPTRRRRPLEPPPDGLPRRVSGSSNDGRELGEEITGAHWDIARAMLDAAKPSPAADADVRLWYQAIASYMAGAYLFSDSGAHLAHARTISPVDAPILFATGCLYETLAAPRVQAVVQGPTRGATGYSVAGVESNLLAAEAWFRRALATDSAMREARVRLAHVLAALGRYDEARDQAQQAVDDPDPVVDYFAHLMLGAAEQALGHDERARAAYERASALFPRAQSPYLSLSQLAERQGRRSEALQAVGKVFAMPPYDTARVDPWWSYDKGGGRRAEALVARMRAALAAAARP